MCKIFSILLIFYLFPRPGQTSGLLPNLGPILGKKGAELMFSPPEKAASKTDQKEFAFSCYLQAPDPRLLKTLDGGTVTTNNGPSKIKAPSLVKARSQFLQAILAKYYSPKTTAAQKNYLFSLIDCYSPAYSAWQTPSSPESACDQLLKLKADFDEGNIYQGTEPLRGPQDDSKKKYLETATNRYLAYLDECNQQYKSFLMDADEHLSGESSQNIDRDCYAYAQLSESYPWCQEDLALPKFILSGGDALEEISSLKIPENQKSKNAAEILADPRCARLISSMQEIERPEKSSLSKKEIAWAEQNTIPAYVTEEAAAKSKTQDKTNSKIKSSANEIPKQSVYEFVQAARQDRLKDYQGKIDDLKKNCEDNTRQKSPGKSK